MAKQHQGSGNMPPPTNKPADLSYPDIAVEYGIDKPAWQALQNLYPGAQPASIVMVSEYCKVRGLDPLKKPVHIVPMYVEDKTTGSKAMRDVIMPGIQEMRITAARTKEYAGIDEVIFGADHEFPLVVGESSVSPQTLTAPLFAKVTVYRLVQGKRYAFTHVERFAEAVARTGKGAINSMWSKRSSGQLAKCAEAGALRKAFPEELGGEYAAEELMGQEHIDVAVIQTEAIPGPEEIPEPQAISAPEALSAPEVAYGQGEDASGLIDPAVGAAAEARVQAREAAKAKPAPAEKVAPKSEVASSFKFDLPQGPMSVLNSQMQSRGVTENALLAEMGEDITVANINRAIGILKMWGNK